jgi:AmmeMemoRadiSam system protein B
MHSGTREAYHAGSWYEDDPRLLGKELHSYLSKATKYKNSDNLKSIIVPHAGYYYSAPTAAKAFININPDKYDRVVVLGPSHNEYFEGCGISPFTKFDTPFGDIPIDTKTTDTLIHDSNFFKLSESVCLNEHSIEMELPFLKYIFGNKNFSLLPLMIGETTFEQNKKIGKFLYDLYNDNKTLFVISSDFCHWGLRFGYTYYDKSSGEIWESIEKLDKIALDIISEMNAEMLDKYFEKTRNTICGRNPITIVLSIIEEYQKQNQDKKLSFECAGYSQSERVKKVTGSSVSYAAGVNFIM